MKEFEKNTIDYISDDEKQFYSQCAISAMQGILESGVKIEEALATLWPKKLAILSFNIADAMLEEYKCKFSK